MPEIAVIIPTYNRADSLRSCLVSLQQQTLPPSEWEVIVVNDGGVDIQKLVSSFGENFQSIYQENTGPAKARNVGASMTNAKIITFLDDDCRATPSWIKNILTASKEGFIIGGKVQNRYSKNIFSEASQLLIDFLYASQERTEDQFFTSNNFSLYKSDFDRFGGFNNDFSTSAGEDREFCVRLRGRGMNLKFIPNIKIGHYHFLNLKTFIRLHKKYGRAAVLFQKSTAMQEIKVTRKPKLSFYKKMISYPFSIPKYSFPYKIALSLVLILSQFCVAWGYFRK